jgi:hypothetical protein
VSVLLINYREKEADLRKQEEKLKEERRIAEEKRYIEEETRKEYQRLEEEKRKEEQRLKEEKKIEYQRLVQVMQEELSKESEDAGKKQPQGNKEVQFVLNKYLAATGADKAKHLISMSISSSSEIDGNQQVTQSKSIFTIDGKCKLVTFSSGKEISKILSNGKKGYTYVAGTKIQMTPELIAAFKKTIHLRLFPEFELRNKPRVSMEGIEEFDGKMAYVIKDENTRYYFDAITNLKIGEVRLMEIPNQNTVSSNVTSYIDYKEYDGIKLPILVVLDNGGKVKTRYKVTEVKFNEIYTDADFK